MPHRNSIRCSAHGSTFQLHLGHLDFKRRKIIVFVAERNADAAIAIHGPLQMVVFLRALFVGILAVFVVGVTNFDFRRCKLVRGRICTV